MALGLSLYWGEKRFDAALKEFEIAAATSPNNAKIYSYIGGIYRRQGRWREAMESCERALSLDPRNTSIVFFAANNHFSMRDWPAATAGYTRALELEPDDVFPKVYLLEVYRNGNPAAGRTFLAGPELRSLIALARRDLAMLERDYVAAEKILSDMPDGEFFYDEEFPGHSSRDRPHSPVATSNRPSVIFPRRHQSWKGGRATIPTSRNVTRGLDYSMPTCGGGRDPGSSSRS